MNELTPMNLNGIEEIWKEIEGYEGIYQVSNTGYIRRIADKDSWGRKRTPKTLNPRVDKKGYLHVALSKNGIRREYKVHRIVAEAFIPNPKKFPQVNHKDENKINNAVNNLEWCNNKYNCNYGTKVERFKRNMDWKKKVQNTDYKRIAKNRKKIDYKALAEQNAPKRKKPVIQMDMEGNELREFASAKDVKVLLGFDNSDIGRCCRGKLKSVGGYKWKFK